MTRFPSTPGTRSWRLGEPLQAKACACGPRAVVEDGGCVVCGHLLPEVIAQTFREQERRLAGDPEFYLELVA